MAFLPAKLRLNGVMLSWFDVLDDIPRQTVRGRNGDVIGVRLATEHIEKWDAIWRAIQRCEGGLKKFIAFSCELAFEEPPPPGQYPYGRTCTNARALYHVVRAARSAFLRHFAFISFLAYLAGLRDDASAQYPSWVDRLMTDRDLETTAYNDLNTTWVFDMSVPRKGAFVDLTLGNCYRGEQPSTQWTDRIIQMSYRVNMPFWLYYPRDWIPAHGTTDAAIEQYPWKLWVRYRAYAEDVERVVTVERPPPTAPSAPEEDESLGVPPPTSPEECQTAPTLREANNYWTYKRDIQRYNAQRQYFDPPGITEHMKQKLATFNEKYLRKGPPSLDEYNIVVWEEHEDSTWTHRAHEGTIRHLRLTWMELAATHKFLDPYTSRCHIAIDRDDCEDTPTGDDDPEEDEDDGAYGPGCVWPKTKTGESD